MKPAEIQVFIHINAFIVGGDRLPRFFSLGYRCCKKRVFGLLSLRTILSEEPFEKVLFSLFEESASDK